MIFFLISHKKNICCDPSSDLSLQDSSDEGSQHMFLCTELTVIIPNYHQILPLIYSSGNVFS